MTHQPLSVCLMAPKPEPTETQSSTSSLKGENICATYPSEKNPPNPNTFCTAEQTYKTEQPVSLDPLYEHYDLAVEQLLVPFEIEDEVQQITQMTHQPLSVCLMAPKPEPTETQSSTSSLKGENICATYPSEKNPSDSNTSCTAEQTYKTEQPVSVDSLYEHYDLAFEQLLVPAVPDPEQRAHTCEYCWKSFSHRFNLQTHIATVHLKQRAYTCEYCEKSFSHKFNLQTHVKTVHLKQRAHTCEYCWKSFSHRFNLQTHIATVHLKQRAYTCEYCEKSFSHKFNLQTHVKTVHLKQRAHTCECCEKSFSHKFNLQTHIAAVHLKQRPYLCEHCEKPFAHNSNLLRHLNSVCSEQRASVCEYRGTLFSEMDDLRAYVNFLHFSTASIHDDGGRTYASSCGIESHCPVC
ncbi:unnamed protein product [Dicrocoelium dendriticum]|nr:unnamed protein product [Dicrocoelium dendriticum]